MNRHQPGCANYTTATEYVDENGKPWNWLITPDETSATCPDSIVVIEDSIRRITDIKGPIYNYTSSALDVGLMLWSIPSLTTAQKEEVERIPGVRTVQRDGIGWDRWQTAEDMGNGETAQWIVRPDSSVIQSSEMTTRMEEDMRRMTGIEGPIAKCTSTCRPGKPQVVMWFIPVLSVEQQEAVKRIGGRSEIELLPGIAEVIQDHDATEYDVEPELTPNEREQVDRYTARHYAKGACS
ncbi:hypothetical protein B0A48_04703 [Cryoendolithus antarcticus]|uniref:Uncharacterized protein n=1 Tax=Cryoendolithus antarcticus TaxID=1507870 RepID=A0A1V8TD59_9PEZI|nr:hypothetical protein B0A48_04703 [Cryoendolithus antarcticus]